MNLSNSDVSLFFARRQDMLTKYALVAIIVLCGTTGIHADGTRLTL